MPVQRFDIGSWLASPLSQRRLDLSRFATERAAVAEICARVAAEGDAALREYSARFEGWSPGPSESFRVDQGELAAASARLAAPDRGALEFAAARIREFHSHQKPLATSGSLGLQLLTRP